MQWIRIGNYVLYLIMFCAVLGAFAKDLAVTAMKGWVKNSWRASTPRAMILSGGRHHGLHPLPGTWSSKSPCPFLQRPGRRSGTGGTMTIASTGRYHPASGPGRAQQGSAGDGADYRFHGRYDHRLDPHVTAMLDKRDHAQHGPWASCSLGILTILLGVPIASVTSRSAIRWCANCPPNGEATYQLALGL